MSVKQVLFGIALTCLTLSALSETRQTIVLTRHFEKAKAADSSHNDPPLTALGKRQALALSSSLESLDVARIYSTNTLRTRQSAEPTAQRSGHDIELYDPHAPERLVQQILTRQQHSLVVGHSNTIPALVEMLGGTAIPLEEDDYGMVFSIHITWDNANGAAVQQTVTSSHTKLSVQ